MYIFNAGKILIEFYFPPIIIFICLIIWSLRVGWSAEPRLGEAAGGRAAVRLYPRRQNRVCPHQQQDQDPRHIQLLDLNLSTVVIVVVIYHVIIVAGGHGIFWHKVMGCILSITGGSLLRPHFLPPQSYFNCCRCLPCNHCSNWTWVVEEILAFGTRLRSTHCREFNWTTRTDVLIKLKGWS